MKNGKTTIVIWLAATSLVSCQESSDLGIANLYIYILAAIVLPLVLLSLYRGLTNQVQLHRKIVRWSFPVWLYVTISGVIVYLMISPYYNF